MGGGGGGGTVVNWLSLMIIIKSLLVFTQPTVGKFPVENLYKYGGWVLSRGVWISLWVKLGGVGGDMLKSLTRGV